MDVETSFAAGAYHGSRLPLSGMLSDFTTLSTLELGPSRRLGRSDSWDEYAAWLALRVEQRRIEAGSRLDRSTRALLGQYFTPAQVAEQLVELAELPNLGELRVLDPGAGVGSLGAALVRKVMRQRPELKLSLTCLEVDVKVNQYLYGTLEDCCQVHPVVTAQHREDFLTWAARQAGSGAPASPYDLVLMNPPFRRIGGSTPERRLLVSSSIHVPNLYAAFVLLSLRLLSPNGQLIAIIPRSWTNGTSFKSFRQQLLRHAAVTDLMISDRRDEAFGDSDVLQDTVLLRAVAGADMGQVRVSHRRGLSDPPTRHLVPSEDIVDPADPSLIFRIPSSPAELSLRRQMASLTGSLAALGIDVSTGRVVDFRSKEALRRLQDERLGETEVPLIYPAHLRRGRVIWPAQISPNRQKPSALVHNNSTAKLLLPAGAYVLVRRFTGKEEPRRVAASLLLASDVGDRRVAIENHLNVLHAQHHGLEPDIAAGLTAFLNSTPVDRYVRVFSGHTQINAADLRSLRYPSEAQLAMIGQRSEGVLGAGEVDSVVRSVLPMLY